MSLASSVPSSESWSPSAEECGCCPSSHDNHTQLTTAPSSSRKWSGKAREGLFTSPEGDAVMGKLDGPLIRVYSARACSWVNGDFEEVGEWFTSLMLSLGIPVYPSNGRFHLSPTGPKLAWLRGSIDIFRPTDDARCSHCRQHKVRNWRGTPVTFPCVVEADCADGPVPVSSCMGCKAAGLQCDLYQGSAPAVAPEMQRFELWNFSELLAVAKDATATLDALSRSNKQGACQQAAMQDVARSIGWLTEQLECAKRLDLDADSKL